jgi:hypothetical protein
MLEADARLIERIIKVKGRKYSQIIIYVPRSLATDSAFPFKPRDMVRLSILGKTLSIQQAEMPYVGVDDNQEKDAGQFQKAAPTALTLSRPRLGSNMSGQPEDASH